MPSLSSKRSNSHSLPSHLYKKRGVFYYRLRLPKYCTGASSQREVRVSLRTGFQTQALAMVKKIHDQVSSLLEQRRDAEEEYLQNEYLINQIRV